MCVGSSGVEVRELLTSLSPCCSQEMRIRDVEKARHFACVLLGCLRIMLFLLLWYIKHFSSYLVFHGMWPGVKSLEELSALFG